MNNELVTSAAGIALIKSFEGCLKRIGPNSFTTYICPAGVLTIGLGHTNASGRQIKPGDVWTQGECDAALREDMRASERAVKKRVKVELTQGQFDALSSFIFNCGEGNFARSTLLRKVNASEFEAAAAHFADWNKAKDPHTGEMHVLNGLTRRRKAEVDLFRHGNHEAVIVQHHVESADDDEPMPQRVESPAGTPKPMSESKIGNGGIAIGLGGAAEAAAKVKDAVDQANSVKAGVKDLGVLDVLSHLVLMPTFWIAVGTAVIAGFIWVWRREHAQAGV
jgi:lysozyme